jgi:hypothetical protein
MIVAQSAATARVYAALHRETLDENADLVGLSAANAVAALSGTFVVNGSPTQTAMVERSGGRSQMASLATAAVVALVLLVLTGPLQYLPRCVLGAFVFTIAVGLVDVRSLRDIGRESRGELLLALVTAAVVVLVGVEQGILLAIALSLLRHVRLDDDRAIGYVRINNSLGSTGLIPEFDSALRELKDAAGLILDLRVANSSRGWPLEVLFTMFYNGEIGELPLSQGGLLVIRHFRGIRDQRVGSRKLLRLTGEGPKKSASARNMTN